jgi:hypothetical protein
MRSLSRQNSCSPFANPLIKIHPNYYTVLHAKVKNFGRMQVPFANVQCLLSFCTWHPASFFFRGVDGWGLISAVDLLVQQMAMFLMPIFPWCLPSFMGIPHSRFHLISPSNHTEDLRFSVNIIGSLWLQVWATRIQGVM